MNTNIRYFYEHIINKLDSELVINTIENNENIYSSIKL